MLVLVYPLCHDGPGPPHIADSKFTELASYLTLIFARQRAHPHHHHPSQTVTSLAALHRHPRLPHCACIQRGTGRRRRRHCCALVPWGGLCMSHRRRWCRGRVSRVPIQGSEGLVKAPLWLHNVAAEPSVPWQPAQQASTGTQQAASPRETLRMHTKHAAKKHRLYNTLLLPT